MQAEEKSINPEFFHKLEIGGRFEAEGRHLHALQVYRKLVDDFPAESSAPMALAGLLEKTSNTESARAILLDAIEKIPENKALRLFAGHFFFRQEAWTETIDILSYLAPEEEPAATFFIAYAYYMLKNYQLASRHFLQYISSAPDKEFTQDAYVYLTKIHVCLEDFENALVYIRKAEEFYSGYHELHLLFAIIYYNMQMTAHAQTAIDKALKLNKNDETTMEWAGKISFQSGDYKKAEKFFKKIVNHADSIDAELLVNLAYACLNNKKAKEAKEYFETILQLFPSHKGAKDGIKKLNNEYFLYEK